MTCCIPPVVIFCLKFEFLNYLLESNITFCVSTDFMLKDLLCYNINKSKKKNNYLNGMGFGFQTCLLCFEASSSVTQSPHPVVSTFCLQVIPVDSRGDALLTALHSSGTIQSQGRGSRNNIEEDDDSVSRHSSTEDLGRQVSIIMTI